MTVSIPETEAASDIVIAKLVENYGDLPPAYRMFLQKHDGARPNPNRLKAIDRGVGVAAFLRASEIPATAAATEGLPKFLMPFAEDGSGNLICIDRHDHRIFFWDHEIDGPIPVSSGFQAFLDELEPFPLDDVQLMPGQVKRVWINPDFKPKF